MDKKLLLIGSSLNYGSPGHICESIGFQAMEDGWTVYQAHGVRYSRPSKLITYQVCSRLGELRHAVNSYLFDSHGLSSKKETNKLVNWIESIEPDVINLHNLHGYYLNYEILFKFLSEYNKPIVWTMHDFWPITGHCVHFDYIGCNKWKTGCYNCPQYKSYPTSLFIDRSKQNYLRKLSCFTSVRNMTIISVSNWVGSIYRQSFLNKYPIKTIYNGINTSIFSYTESDLRSRLNIVDQFVLLGVASPWYKLKGYDDYMKLSQLLPDDCVIIMIGLDKKQISALPKNIIGIERIDNQAELAQFYSMADIVLNLSYQETFGMTTIEGMSCGTPSIVYDRTASPELVTTQTGKIVEAGNIVGLLNAILLIRDKKRSHYSAKCREWAKSQFDEYNQYKKYIELYNNLILK